MRHIEGGLGVCLTVSGIGGSGGSGNSVHEAEALSCSDRCAYDLRWCCASWNKKKCVWYLPQGALRGKAEIDGGDAQNQHAETLTGWVVWLYALAYVEEAGI